MAKMPASRAKHPVLDAPAELAQRLAQSLVKERIVPRFVDSYVVEHARYGLQVHAALYRDLLGLLQREALLAASARALELACSQNESAAGGKRRGVRRKSSPAAFRRRFLAALTRQQGWTAGDALDFQSDLRMYEELLARHAGPRRARKPFETANHPFVDRCAFLLDSSFLEEARLAASRALLSLEETVEQVAASVVQTYA